MTPEQERWAEALAIEHQHGDSAAAHVASRIVELGAAGDHPGVQRWREIGARLDELARGRAQ